MQQNRDVSFDFMKGILIILVVLGHGISLMYGPDNMNLWTQPCFNVIYTFHMPLFVFISGVFLRHSLSLRPGMFLYKRVTRLAIPCVVFSTLILMVYVLTHDMSLPPPYQIYRCYCSYWYLVCVFILSFVSYVFVRTRMSVRTLLALAYIGLLLVSDRYPLLVLRDCQVIRQTVIFGLGIYLSERLLTPHGSGTYGWRMILLLTIPSLIAVVVVRLSYGMNMLRYPEFVRVIDGIACSALAFIVIKGLFRLLSDMRITQTFVWLGRNSLSVYLTHILVVFIIRWGYADLITSWTGVLSWFLLTMLLCVVCIHVEKRLLKSKSFILGV